MLRVLLIITQVFLAAHSKANELNVPIDAQYSKVSEKMMGEAREQCYPLATGNDQLACMFRVMGAYKDAGLLRGNREYALKNYSNLDDKNLYAKHVELGKLIKIARKRTELPGELSWRKLVDERMWVKEELLSRWKKAGKDPLQEKKRLDQELNL